LALPEHHLPDETSFVIWFRANEPGLRRDSTRRDRNAIIAAQFLRIFEKEPRGWGVLGFFNGASNPNQSLSQLFADWPLPMPAGASGVCCETRGSIRGEGVALEREEIDRYCRFCGSQEAVDDKFPCNESEPVSLQRRLQKRQRHESDTNFGHVKPIVVFSKISLRNENGEYLVKKP
jgi:hypothetical protein